MSTDEVEWSCDQAWNMEHGGAKINIDTMEEFVFFILCLRDLARLTVCK